MFKLSLLNRLNQEHRSQVALKLSTKQEQYVTSATRGLQIKTMTIKGMVQ